MDPGQQFGRNGNYMTLNKITLGCYVENRVWEGIRIERGVCGREEQLSRQKLIEAS